VWRLARQGRVRVDIGGDYPRPPLGNAYTVWSDNRFARRIDPGLGPTGIFADRGGNGLLGPIWWVAEGGVCRLVSASAPIGIRGVAPHRCVRQRGAPD